MVAIEKKLIKYNFTSNKNNPFYIVIHDTANTNAGADAEAHFRYFNQADRKASAHIFVDDKKVLQLIEFKDCAWHVGDGGGIYGITNSNSIGIELCINSEGNYDKTFETTLKLTKQLMKLYNIPIERVVRHYDASRKLCPGTMKNNNWEKWKIFKNKLNNQIEDNQTNDNQTTNYAKEDISMRGVVTSNNGLNIRTNPSVNANILGVIPKDTVVDIISKEANFYKIVNKNVKGYVSADFINISWTKPLNVNYKEKEPTYRVRKIWGDIQSQLGAFTNLDTAKIIVDKNKGYFVFDENGNKVYSNTKING